MRALLAAIRKRKDNELLVIGDHRKTSSHRVVGPHQLALTVTLALLMFCVGCQSGPRPAPTTPALPTSAQAGNTMVVAVAGPSPPQFSLPKFLGLDLLFGGVRAVGQRIRNRLGSRFPGLEPKPPLLSITDPANMSEDAPPAVKAAAEAKAEEDKAPQKAKAIRYLASLGCGKCYPDTEDALLAALEDCTELIRYETVKGLRDSVGDPCQCCRQNSCCSPKLLQKLHQLAFEMNMNGCYYEPSARVRRYARLVIRGCGGVQTEFSPGVPLEGPSMDGPVMAEPVAAADPAETAADAAPTSLGSGLLDQPQVPASIALGSDLLQRY